MIHTWTPPILHSCNNVVFCHTYNYVFVCIFCDLYYPSISTCNIQLFPIPKCRNALSYKWNIQSTLDHHQMDEEQVSILTEFKFSQSVFEISYWWGQHKFTLVIQWSWELYRWYSITVYILHLSTANMYTLRVRVIEVWTRHSPPSTQQGKLVLLPGTHRTWSLEMFHTQRWDSTDCT